MTDRWDALRKLEQELHTRNHLGNTLSERLEMMIAMPPNWDSALPRLAAEVRNMEHAMEAARNALPELLAENADLRAKLEAMAQFIIDEMGHPILPRGHEYFTWEDELRLRAAESLGAVAQQEKEDE